MKAGTWNTHCPGIKNPQDYVGFVLIPGFPHYCINNRGIVISNERIAWNGIAYHTLKSRRLKQAKAGQGGYYKVTLRRDGKSYQRYIHRLVAETFIKPEPGKNVVNHKDANVLNNNVSNLEWCTSADNSQHAKEMGLIPSGTNHWKAKLTNDDVETIKKVYTEGGITMSELATRYQICVDSIWKVIRGKSYA